MDKASNAYKFGKTSAFTFALALKNGIVKDLLIIVQNWPIRCFSCFETQKSNLNLFKNKFLKVIRNLKERVILFEKDITFNILERNCQNNTHVH